MSNPYLLLSEYDLHHLPAHLAACEMWEDADDLLTDLFFLEAKAEAGLAFALAGDFSMVVGRLPAEWSLLRTLKLLEEALRRDIHFIVNHPTALFQCLWNSCWWYDCPASADHYQAAAAPFWSHLGPSLSALLERWRSQKEMATPGFRWLRSLRPPPIHLGTALLQIYRGHDNAVDSVALSRDGQRVASSSRDGTIRVWSADSGQLLSVIRIGELNHVAFSPDGAKVVGVGKSLRVWDARSGDPVMTLKGHEGESRSVAFAPDGRTIATGGESDNTVRTWDLETGAPILELPGHTAAVSSVAFSPDGLLIVSGSRDRTVRLWRADDGHPVAVLKGHARSVNCVAYSPDGRLVASGDGERISRGGSIRVWDPGSGDRVAVFPDQEEMISSLAFAPGGSQLASGSFDGSVRLWEPRSGNQLAVLGRHETYVSEITFSSDGQRLVTGSYDRTVRVWNADRPQPIVELRDRQDLILGIAVSPDGKLVATGSNGGSIQIWNAQAGRQTRAWNAETSGFRSGLAFSPDGRHLASGSRKTVRIWDVERGRQIAEFRGHREDVECVAYSPNGEHIASGSEDGTVRVWELASGRQIALFGDINSGRKNKTNALAFSACGYRIIVGAWQQDVRVWDIEFRNLVAQYETSNDYVSGVAFSQDDRRVAIATERSGVRVLASDGGACVESVPGSGDAHAIAAGPELFMWRALTRGQGLEVENAMTAQVVGRFPGAMRDVKTIPTAKAWAAEIDGHLYLLKLEGAD